MHETFQLRKKILAIGIGGTLLFLAVSIGFASVYFLDDPARHGFRDADSARLFASIGVVFFGSWTLAGLYVLLTFYMQRVEVVDSSISIRSVFRNYKFEFSKVDSLKWRTIPAGGSVVLREGNEKVKLDLGNFANADRGIAGTLCS